MKKYVEFFLAFLIAIDLVALMLKLTHLFSTGGAYERSAAALRANDLVEVHRLQERANVLTRRITLESRAQQDADELRIRGEISRDPELESDELRLNERADPPPVARRPGGRHAARRLTTGTADSLEALTAADWSPGLAAPPADVRRARRATALVFALHGCVVGSFVARIPWIASHVGVEIGQLGLALLMPGLGALLAMPFSGRLAHRHGVRPLVTTTIVAFCASLALTALPTSLALLCVALLVFGATAGLADMAMNTQGVLVEKALGRSVMSSLHGFWSVGLLLGSLISALASHAGTDTRVQFALTAIVLAAVGTAAARFLLDDPAATEREAPPAFALPTRPVLLIGLVGLCAVFGELAGADWSAVYIQRELGGSTSVAALAVSAFAVTMAAVRLMGDRVIGKLGPVRTGPALGGVRRDRSRGRRLGARSGGWARWVRAARHRSRCRRPARVRRSRPCGASPCAQHRRGGRRRLRQRSPRTRRDRRHRSGVIPDHFLLSGRRPHGDHGACCRGAARLLVMSTRRSVLS